MTTTYALVADAWLDRHGHDAEPTDLGQYPTIGDCITAYEEDPDAAPFPHSAVRVEEVRHGRPGGLIVRVAERQLDGTWDRDDEVTP